MQIKGKRYAFVGTWKDFGGHGEGIYVYEIDRDTGDMKETFHLTGYRNNSILAVSPDKKYLFSTLEDKNYKDIWGNGGGVLALSINPSDGTLSPLNECSSMGACTSYICTDPEGSRLLITNHGSGLDIVTKVERGEDGTYYIVNEYDDAPLVMFEICEDGMIGNILDLHKHQGKGGINVHGQVCSHLHSVNFDKSGKWVLVCDKGTDSIYVYRINREKNLLENTPHTIYKTRKGTAPRHLEFHPFKPYFFVNNETASTVTSYHFDEVSGMITELDYQPMIDMDESILPEEIGDTYGSPADIHVHPNGRFLYSSERSSYNTGKGVSLISVFLIDEENGKIQRTSTTVMDGPCPRGFAIDPEGRFLYVGNQYIDTICRYRIEESDGSLLEKTIVATPATPTCIRIVDY